MGIKIFVVLSYLTTMSFASPLTITASWDANWEQWKTTFNKTYDDETLERTHYFNWKSNQAYVEQHNKDASAGKYSFTVTMNKWADTDFENRPPMGKYINTRDCTPSQLYVMNPLPEKVDWREEGYVTHVKDQGLCGSCWAFSTTGSLEGQHFRATGKLVSLSEQNLVDCSGPEGDLSCAGGLIDYAFEYVIKNGGIATEESYPYEGMVGECRFDGKRIGATMTSCVDVTPREDEAVLRNAVAQIGPISVTIDASHRSLTLYDKGVYDEPDCSSTYFDHGVLVVGYGSENGLDYWIVKNSWSADWGDQGYVKMIRNKGNQCGIATDPSYPVVQDGFAAHRAKEEKRVFVV